MRNKDLLIVLGIVTVGYYLSKQRKADGADSGEDAAKEKGKNVVLFKTPPLPNAKP